MRRNPIERRIEMLSDQWHAFASARGARVLCWRFAPTELGMFEAFLACEGDERLAEHGDVFVTLNAPFAEPERYGSTLMTALTDAYLENRDAWQALGAEAGWEPVRPQRREGDLPFLLRACASLRAHHALEGKFVLVLRPQRVSSPAAQRRWLQAFAAAAPEWLRAIVIDDLEHPGYGELLRPPSRAIIAVDAQLDMAGALQELSNAAGRLDTPGGSFRDLFVQVANRLGKGDLPAALALGDRALALVAEHGLGLLGVPLRFALGSGLLGAGRVDDAIAQFEAAEAVAVRGEREGPADARATCRALRLHARLALASALLSTQAFERAARHCEETEPVARAAEDPRAELDCHRLASLAWARAGQRDRALLAGQRGLAVAGAMDPETRATSTFEYLANDLLALTAGIRQREARRQVERDLAELRDYSAGRAQGSVFGPSAPTP